MESELCSDAQGDPQGTPFCHYWPVTIGRVTMLLT